MTINVNDLINSIQMVGDFCKTYKKCSECPVSNFCEQYLSGKETLVELMETLSEEVKAYYDC